MYFADFWAIFLRFFVFLPQMGVEKPLLLEQFLDTKWFQFCGYEGSFC